MVGWLFEEFGQQGRRFRAGQFRLPGERITLVSVSPLRFAA